MLKRPFVWIFMSLVMMVYCIANTYNPVIPILKGFSQLGGSSIIEGVIGILQLVLNKTLILKVLLAYGALTILLSLLAGLLLSGYLNVVNNALDGKQRFNGEFLIGIRKYFGRLFFITFRLMIIGLLFVVFLMIACVPAIVITKTAITSAPDLYIAAVIVDILTVMVLFFSVVFFETYVLFWYPAVIHNEPKPFRAGKRMADTCFWKLMLRFLAFDALFILIEAITLILDNALAALLVSWVLKTIFFSTLVVFVFASFKLCRMKKRAA
jgi:hypothetical protein